MVAPLAAVAGRAMMGAGSRMAGTAATRSAAGQGLKSGVIQGADALKSIDGIFKLTKKIFPILSSIGRNVVKMVGFLAKQSPALTQQLKILSASITLFFRPIGDALSRIIAPAILGIFKVTQKWYRWTTRPSVNVVGKMEGPLRDLTDELKTLKEQKETLEGLGLPTDDLDAKIAELEGKLKGPFTFLDLFSKEGWEQIKKLGADIASWASKVWNEYIVPGWNTVVGWAGRIWDEYIVPGWTAVITWATKIWDDYFAPTFSAVLGWVGKIWDDYFAPSFSAVITWATKIWDEYFVTGFEGLKDWGSKVWSLIKSAAGSLFGKSSDSGEAKEKAIGGSINRTGLYKLHAGERVLTAGDTSRANSQSANIDITNHININASISNNMDIRQLAQQLAELQETELRRRVSYL